VGKIATDGGLSSAEQEGAEKPAKTLMERGGNQLWMDEADNQKIGFRKTIYARLARNRPLNNCRGNKNEQKNSNGDQEHGLPRAP
jgi:hypothetical protein